MTGGSGRRAVPVRPRGARDKGLCPHCHRWMTLVNATGKMVRHGEASDLCPGTNGRPMTRAQVREYEARHDGAQ